MSNSSKLLKELGTTPARGFRDILPKETALRDQLMATILETYRSYGFERIEAPIVEDIRRLKMSDGGENLALLFEILKRGEKLDLAASTNSRDELVDLGLRYDLTVPLARYFANNRGQLLFPFKAIHIGPAFRAERPQKGRFRQFYQCDIDCIGVPAPFAEIELITATLKVIEKIGFKEATVRVNDRRILLAMTAAAGIVTERAGLALVILDKLDKVGLDGVRDLLLKEQFATTQVETFIQLAREIEAAQQNERVAKTAQLLSGKVGEEVCKQMQDLLVAVEKVLPQQTKVIFDPFLVRGMGYYTGAVFEISLPGFDGSVAGGGRYDNLIGKLSGSDVPACGFSIGFERVVSLLVEQGASGRGQVKRLGLYYPAETSTMGAALLAQQALQAQGYHVSLLPEPKNLKEALKKLELEGYVGFVRFKAGEQPTPRFFAAE